MTFQPLASLHGQYHLGAGGCAQPTLPSRAPGRYCVSSSVISAAAVAGSRELNL
jgi:hypothetical protein